MIFGWDVSTAIIGCAIFDDECNFLSASYCDLRKIDGLNEKADEAQKFVHFMIDEKDNFGATTVHYIEDRLAGMAGGSNAGTIMRLAAFNAIVSWVIWREKTCLNDEVRHLHPSTVKAIMKKEGLVIPKGGDKKRLTLDFVRSRESAFPYRANKNDNPQPYCFDMSDAYITARAGYLKFLKNA